MKPDEWFSMWMTLAQIVGGAIFTVLSAFLGARFALAHAERQRQQERRDEAIAVVRTLLPKIEDKARGAAGNLTGGAAYLRPDSVTSESDWRRFAWYAPMQMQQLHDQLETELAYWWHWLDDEALVAALRRVIADVRGLADRSFYAFLDEPLSEDSAVRAEVIAQSIKESCWADTIETHLRRLAAAA